MPDTVPKMSLAVELAERGFVPDPVLRIAIRQLVRRRLAEEAAREAHAPAGVVPAFVEELRRSPVALVPDLANRQHYEVPARLFELALGRRLKYSACWWPPGVSTLDDAEERMLALTAERAGLADGQRVLDLGCGWGSLSLWIAERFPASRVLAVSNSKPQRELILARAARLGLANVDVRTADANDFDPGERFDRILSIELFEHLRNYERFLGRVAGWLEPAGRLFVHVFCHARYAYPFDAGEGGSNDWMARNFFTGGLMPSRDLLLHFQRDLVVEASWTLSGDHYQRTAEAWLANLDARRAEAEALFVGTHGVAGARRAVQRWRMFFLACAELFGHHGGSEWGIAHYRFARASTRAPMQRAEEAG